MPRAPRDLQPGFCYHVTVRCNNREFRLSERACREVLLDAIKMGLEKYGFMQGLSPASEGEGHQHSLGE